MLMWKFGINPVSVYTGSCGWLNDWINVKSLAQVELRSSDESNVAQIAVYQKEQVSTSHYVISLAVAWNHVQRLQATSRMISHTHAKEKSITYVWWQDQQEVLVQKGDTSCCRVSNECWDTNSLGAPCWIWFGYQPTGTCKASISCKDLLFSSQGRGGHCYWAIHSVPERSRSFIDVYGGTICHGPISICNHFSKHTNPKSLDTLPVFCMES